MRIISGTYKNRIINSPKGLNTRPTAEHIREAVFNICQTYIEGARFLDLFAGSGAMGLEALSRGAQSATFIDNNRDSIRCIESNLTKLGLRDRSLVFCGDALTLLERLAAQKKQFDIIYIDPPYDKPGEEKSLVGTALRLIDRGSLLAADGTVFLESSGYAMDPIEDLENLIFERSRRFGRTYIQQYINRNP